MKKITFTFGRFNPPTAGHAKLIQKVLDHSEATGSEHRVYASQSHDPDKNPIGYEEKMGYLSSLFPGVNIHHDPKAISPFHVAKSLSDEGYDHVTMVTGGDRVDEFRQKIGKYVKPRSDPGYDPSRHYGFRKFNVISAGDRDASASGVEGISGTKMREHVRNNDMDSFVKGLPETSPATARKIFRSIQKGSTLKESVEHDEIMPGLESFVSFAADHLGLPDRPSIRRSDVPNTFGSYNPSTKEITITTKNRHPMDVFRTLAHELCHHKQNLEGRIKDVAKEGSDGSDIENEANSQAGIIMRKYAKKNPNHFQLKPLLEQYLSEGRNDPSIFKAVFLAGGPGSGKDFILNQTLDGNGMTEINSDKAFEFLMRKEKLDFLMPKSQEKERDIVRLRGKGITKEKEHKAIDGRQGIIVNGTASDPSKIAKMKKKLEDMGYDTMMVYVSTDDEVSKQRNFERGQRGGREVPEHIRKEKWDEARAARDELAQIFGPENFVNLDNSLDIRKVDKDTADKKKGEFLKVHKQVKSFVAKPPSKEAAHKWMRDEISKSGATQEPKTRSTKISLKGNSQMAASSGSSSQMGQRPASGQMGQSGDAPGNPRVNTVSPDIMAQARRFGLQYYGFGRFGRNHTVTHVERNGKLVAKNSINERFERYIKEEHGAGEWGTPELTDNYKDVTPGEKRKLTRKVVYSDRDNSGGLGPEFNGARNTYGYGSAYSFSLNEDINAWANSDKTQERFIRKYGKLAEQKLIETVDNLTEIYGTESTRRRPKHIREFLNYGEDQGTLPEPRKSDDYDLPTLKRTVVLKKKK